ncbi:hypothetical protein BRC96_08980 [Halobacteriales archaeon QS_6_64_34]|nr:MAG: hypothetical protein BRC96_08980 [Halobacteriales archaeon QS_6_64_34]
MPSDEWDHVGRQLLHAELAECRFALDAAFHEAEEALAVLNANDEYAGDLDPEHIIELRRCLNRARRNVENYAAPVTDGVEPWGEPVPSMPYGKYREILEG